MQARLQQLKDLFDKGLISKEVYETEQKNLLSGVSVADKIQPSTNGLLDPKKNLAVIQKLAIFAGVILFGIFVVYNISDNKDKDSINQFASQTGIGTQVIPWSDRADSAVRNLIAANQQGMADAIQGITHPTGKEPTITEVTVDKFKDHILANITVSWKGGFIGNSYQTTVTWDIGEKDHKIADVTTDTAEYNVEPDNAKALNDYFHTKVYPAFYSDMGN